MFVFLFFSLIIRNFAKDFKTKAYEQELSKKI